MLVLVGLMGAGKSSIGNKLSNYLNVGFIDADSEIEKAAGMTIVEIFEKFGEKYFRAGEKKYMVFPFGLKLILKHCGLEF